MANTLSLKSGVDEIEGIDHVLIGLDLAVNALQAVGALRPQALEGARDRALVTITELRQFSTGEAIVAEGMQHHRELQHGDAGVGFDGAVDDFNDATDGVQRL